MAQFDPRTLTPIVQHGTREIRMGAPLEHVLREVALVGALMGTGMTAQQALQYVEQRERQMIGMPARGEAWEPWHRAPAQPQPRPQPRPPVTRPGVPYGYPAPGMGAPGGGTAYPPMMGSWQ